MSTNPFTSPTSALSRRGFLAATAGSLLVAGCGSGPGSQSKGVGGFSGKPYNGPKLELAYWNGFTGGDGPAMQALVKEFASSHDKVGIKNNTIQWTDFYQRLPAATKAGKGPDVGAMHLDQLATNAARSVIVPLDDLAKSLDLSESDFAPSVWGPGIYKDKRYGIPLDVHTIAMYYNKDHFEKAGISDAPTDAASLDDACKKLQAAGIQHPFWIPNQWPAHLMFLSLLSQFGGQPYAEDGSEATYDDEAGNKALSWMREQVDKGYSPKAVDIDSQYAAFKNGKNSITWDGIWQINDLEASGLNYGIAPVPTIFDKPAFWANSHHFFISTQAAKDENKLQASKVFIAWMSEHSADWAGSGMIPARKSVRADAVKGKPQEVIAEQIENMHFLPPVPGLGGVQAEALEPAVANGVLGKGSPADELKSAASKANQLMERNRESFGD